jgi:two-component system response regulator YesN
MPEHRIASLLFRMFAELNEGKRVRHHYVRQVQDHIRTLYMQPLRVEMIAEQMNLDRRYLSRLFKARTGQIVQEYLISVRLEEAQKRLEEGFSVEETARLCGYEDPCNFSKMFKRRLGVSPLYWKQERK